MSNHNHHDHAHIPQDKKILAISFLLTGGFMMVEFWAGWNFNSLALMADAGHMANDCFSLLLAWVALFLSTKKQRYFALLNGLSLIVVAMSIGVEAIERLQTPAQIQALPMMMVATLGLVVNIVVAWLMLDSDHHNLNIKAAYLHVLTDLFGSLVAIIAGFFAWWLHWYWVDVVASMVLSLFVFKSGISVVKQAWQN